MIIKERLNKSRKLKIAVILLIIAAVMVLVCALIVGAANIYVISSSNDYILDMDQAEKLENIDCVIVLGARVFEDGTLSDILTDRVSVGIEVYNSGVTDRMLMSGGLSDADNVESIAMMLYAAINGVPEENIFCDHAGFNTYDTMYRAKNVFGVERAIIVTQDFHLSRAVYMARELGIEAYGVASDPRTYASEGYNNFRELFARTKAVWSVVSEKEARYGGEVIPISGSGLATHTD